MKSFEFEVHGEVPPRNVRDESMWSNETEAPRAIEFRKSAFKAFRATRPLSEKIILEIDIHIPKTHNKPGDLDNFIKGICDALSKRKKDPLSKLHKKFELPENRDIHPDEFQVIEDDVQIVEIHAKKEFVDSEDWYYKIRIKGE